MTLEQFNMLDEMEQAEAIWGGKNVAKRSEGEFEVLLYQIDGFYIEVYYHVDGNSLWKFNPITSKQQLNTYSDQINLNQIL